MSYGELNSTVNRFAQALLRHGYQRGDALALVSGNSTEFLIVFLETTCDRKRPEVGTNDLWSTQRFLNWAFGQLVPGVEHDET